MSRLRPLLLLSLALLALLPAPVQASGVLGLPAAGTCGPAGCCCDTPTDFSGPTASPAMQCPCAAPTPMPAPAPTSSESRADPAATLPLALVGMQPCGTLVFAPAVRRLVREPPAPPPVREVFGVRLL